MHRILSLLLPLTLLTAAETFSWQEPQAEVDPTGELRWAPRPFVYPGGAVVRHIDFAGGNDNHPGTRDQPWQHHPWDPAATRAAASARGPATYVFKGGVIYRGALTATESGRREAPIRLTCDPSWGTGPAWIYGSTRISGGWRRCTAADAGRVPVHSTLWYVDLGADYDPDAKKDLACSALFQVDGETIQRLHLARDPDFALPDPDVPMSTWHRWTTFQGFMNKGTLTDPWLKGRGGKNLLDGAWVWTQHAFLMGSVHRLRPQDYNPAVGSVAIQSGGGANFGIAPKNPIKLSGVHYYLENVAEFLDAEGEYWFDARGAHPGRLYLRPRDGRDPNQTVFEVAQIRCPITITDQSHIDISGLGFRFNDPDDGTYGWPPQIGCSPCVRIIGNCREISVHHCRFEHVAGAVVAFPRPEPGDKGPPSVWQKELGRFANDVMEDITITDNDIRHVERDHAIACVGNGEKQRGVPFGRLGAVRILRNRVVDTGFRPGTSPTSSIPAIKVALATTAEIAGNIVQDSWGNGIITIGGRQNGSFNPVPLVRYLIYRNRIDNTMRGCNDYGGLEHFQCGPAYIFNNITRNAVGTRTFHNLQLGYDLYLDGAFKCYAINNLIGPARPVSTVVKRDHCGYFMVFGFLNQFVHNTVHGVDYGINGSSGNRSCVLANSFVDCAKTFIGQNRPGDVSMEFGGDSGAMGRAGIPTMAYAANRFWGRPTGTKPGAGDAFGFVGGSRAADGSVEVHKADSLDQLATTLASLGCREASIGTMADTNPLPSLIDDDWRPAKTGGGVRFFVPWALYAVVGEWHFLRHPTTPQVVLGEHFYPQAEHYERSMYYHVPRNDLMVNACTAADYVDGPLEDWTAGALAFDGQREAVLTRAEMTRSVDYPIALEEKDGTLKVGSPKKNDGGTTRYDGTQRETPDMQANDFLVEVMLRAERGGLIAGTLQRGRGWALRLDEQGRAVMDLNGWSGTGPGLADRAWHHLLVEVDRADGVVRFHLDGRTAATATISLPAGTALTSGGDLVVGRGLVGALDFLRIARGTLAAARTSLAELHAWQFAGPHLIDFTGRSVTGQRSIGAMEPGSR